MGIKYWWTIKSRLQQRKLYQFTLQNYILSSNTHLLTLYSTDFFFFGMKLKWKPALFTLFLPSGDNLSVGGRPTPLENFLGKVFLISPVIISRVRRLSWGAGVQECQKTWWGQANVMGIMCPLPPPPPDWNKVNLLFKIWWGTGPVPTSPNVPATLQRGKKEQQHQRETISVPSNKHVLLSCAWHKTPGRVECSLFSCLNRLGCPNIKSLKLFHANETNFIDAILRTTALVQK